MQTTLDSAAGDSSILAECGQRGIYSIASLDLYPELLHGISTRTSPSGSDWNMSSRRGTPQHPPSPGQALANRLELAAQLGVSLESMVGCRQVHGGAVAVVGPPDAGRGMSEASAAVEGADALVTATPGLNLMVLSADCPPVLLYDPVKKAIGLAHSGWKGTVAKIAANTVRVMACQFGSHPRDIIAAVGPGIGACCYAVGPEVVKAVEGAFLDTWEAVPPLLIEREGRTYFSLQSAIRIALLEAGVKDENITLDPVCTMHHTDLFYSHRGEKGQCGLFSAVLGLRVA